jgi:DtxR family transcriptional regulator, Mn-dependent transcriptional regulator
MRRARDEDVQRSTFNVIEEFKMSAPPKSLVSHKSESHEMYLKSLAELGAGFEPVPVARVAERLGVTQVSANEMMKRLAEWDLVTHLPYKGMTLTDSGRKVAHDVMRRQRLWECFLVNHLGLPWGTSYEFACSLEHATAPEVVEALAAYLGYPAACPHGHPIPDSNGRLAPLGGILLPELEIDRPARITAVFPESAQTLTYLADRRLVPQQVVTVGERAPLDGPLTVRVAESEVALGLGLAGLIRVEPLDA